MRRRRLYRHESTHAVVALRYLVDALDSVDTAAWALDHRHLDKVEAALGEALSDLAVARDRVGAALPAAKGGAA